MDEKERKERNRKCAEDERQRKDQKPVVEDLESLLRDVGDQFGVTLKVESAKELPSYDDVNYSLYAKEGERFLLKIHNGVDSANLPFIEAQVAAMREVTKSGYVTSVPLPLLSSSDKERDMAKNVDDGDSLPSIGFVTLSSKGGGMSSHAVRLLRWVEGTLLSSLSPESLTKNLLESYGEYCGKISLSLSSLTLPALDRLHMWDLRQFGLIEEFTGALRTDSERLIIKKVIDFFNSSTQSRATKFRSISLHNDMNTHNFLLLSSSPSPSFAVIDYGEMVNSWAPIELALVAAYTAIDQVPMEEKDRVGVNMLERVGGAVTAVVSGFLRTFPLLVEEHRALPALSLSRIAQSVTLSLYSFSLAPSNLYLLDTVDRGMALLDSVVGPNGSLSTWESFFLLPPIS